MMLLDTDKILIVGELCNFFHLSIVFIYLLLEFFNKGCDGVMKFLEKDLEEESTPGSLSLFQP